MTVTLMAFGFTGLVCPSIADEGLSSVLFCDLLLAPGQYDRRVVLTQALVGSGEHEVFVYDDRCMSSATDNRSASMKLPDGWNSTNLGKKLSKVLRHHRTAMVSFESVFYSTGGPFGPEGTRFRFVMQRLVSVREVSKKEASGL
jgi:hypothetical protein